MRRIITTLSTGGPERRSSYPTQKPQFKVDREGEDSLTPQERGNITDGLIEFALVPNRRVILQRAAVFDFSCNGYDDKLHKRLRVVALRDGETHELIAVSDWTEKIPIGGYIEMTGVKRGNPLQESAQLGYAFLESILKAKI